jgi:hypothetical protein
MDRRGFQAGDQTNFNPHGRKTETTKKEKITMWTAEKIFNRETFEAWLASQPGDRGFDYFDNCGCACAAFVKETTSISNPIVGGTNVSLSLEDFRGIDMPDWLWTMLRDVPNRFTIADLRASYQSCFHIDVCAEYPVEVMPAQPIPDAV